MKILYFGDGKSSSTSFHRSEALKRLGHEVIVHDPQECYGSQLTNKYIHKIHYATGYRLLQNRTRRWLEDLIVKMPQPDLIWVNSGEFFGSRCLEVLRSLNRKIILYNNDDPTGRRDGRKFDMVLQAIRFYDLCVVRREESVNEYKQYGAKAVLKVLMSYDEVFHAPFPNVSDIPSRFRSDVAFIGTWMKNEHRDRFILTLIDNGINVNIWGGRWQKSPLWARLASHYKGQALAGRDYVAAIQGSKICLGLLSKGNRDLHTRRSVEIPFIGGLLCAERTSEHVQMYREGEEAVFWDNAEECLQVCQSLLADQERRERIRIAGMSRVRALMAGNEDICRKIMQTIINI
jgi:glycosyl transferase family 1